MIQSFAAAILAVFTLLTNANLAKAEGPTVDESGILQSGLYQHSTQQGYYARIEVHVVGGGLSTIDVWQARSATDPDPRSNPPYRTLRCDGTVCSDGGRYRITPLSELSYRMDWFHAAPYYRIAD